MRNRTSVVSIMLLVCVVALARAPKPLERFDGSAVWKPKDEQQAFADMRQCGAMHAGGSEGSFATCVGEAMRKHGASKPAIAFNAATGGNAYATRLRKMGSPVDVMEAMNPFMANSNDQVFFVNGDPVAVSADEQAMKLDGKKNPQFQALQKTYPEAFIFPHAEMQSLQVIMTRTGQAFTLQFPIVNGCHACARVGQAIVEYDFDSSGHFTGATLTAIMKGAQDAGRKQD